MVKEIKFDDIETLNSLVAEEFGPFGEPYEIDQEKVNIFADLTHDHQWVHVDVDRARAESPFGETIVHGFFTLSLAPRLRPTSTFKIVGHSNGLNYGLDTVRFVSPVPTGTSVHGRTRIDSVEVKKNGTLLNTEMAIHVVGNDTPSVIFMWKILYRP